MRSDGQRKIPDWKGEEMAQLHARGLSIDQVAAIFGVSRSTVYRFSAGNRPHNHRKGVRSERP